MSTQGALVWLVGFADSGHGELADAVQALGEFWFDIVKLPPERDASE